MENFEELIEQARSQPLMKEALAQLGVTLKKVGHGRNGSIRWQTATKPGKEGDFSAVAFFENRDGSWVAIDHKQRTGKHALDALGVLTKLYGVPFSEAVMLLSGGNPAKPGRKIDPPSRTASAEQSPVERTPFVSPPRAEKHNHAFAYLNKTRCIPGNVVSALLHIGAVYESSISLTEGKSTPLVVFPIYNEKGENIGADSCSANSRFRYKHICAGSDPSCTWYVKNNVKVVTPETPMYFCESSIDAISLLCLQNRPGVYVSMTGVKDEKLEIMTKRFGGAPVICTDNDEAGNLFRKRHPDCRTLLPETGKDWNDELRFRFANRYDFALIEHPEQAIPYTPAVQLYGPFNIRAEPVRFTVPAEYVIATEHQIDIRLPQGTINRLSFERCELDTLLRQKKPTSKAVLQTDGSALVQIVGGESCRAVSNQMSFSIPMNTADVLLKQISAEQQILKQSTPPKAARCV